MNLTDPQIHWLLFIGGMLTGAIVTTIIGHIILESQYDKNK